MLAGGMRRENSIQTAQLQFKRSDFRLVACPQRPFEPLQILLVDYGEMLFALPPRKDAYEADGLEGLFPPVVNELEDKSSPAGPGWSGSISM